MFPHDPHGLFLRNVAKMNALNHQMEEVKRQLGGLDAKDLAMLLEQNQMAKMIQGLRNARSGIDFHLGLPKHFFDNLKQQDRLAELAGAFRLLPIDAVSAFKSSFAASTAVVEALNAAGRMADLARLKSITEPWENAARAMRSLELSPEMASFNETLKYLPLIGRAVAGEIADHWRYYGIALETRVISQRLEKLLTDDAPSEDEIEEFSRDFSQFTEKKAPDLSSFLSLLLVLVIFLYQEYSSSQSEERISAKIETVQTQQRQSDAELKVLQATIVRALEQVQPSERGQTVFVVRDRVALIKKDVLPSSPVVGSLVPNQTAVLLEGKGKWIRVEYFDWHSQSARQGWVLKKYLSRVPAKQK